MAYTVHNGQWIVEGTGVNHVRAVDIILDSRANGSALPLEYANAGVATTSDSKLRFVDVEVSLLNIARTRVASVDFGLFFAPSAARHQAQSREKQTAHLKIAYKNQTKTTTNPQNKMRATPIPPARMGVPRERATTEKEYFS